MHPAGRLGPANGEIVYSVIQPSLVVVQVDEPNANGTPGHGIGSGVIVSDAGAVLTALHVVAEAQSIHLTFADGSKSDATVAARDPSKDIAVLEPATVPVNVAPATLNLENPSVATEIDLVPLKPRSKEINTVLSNSFGFGGTNASLIFRACA